MTTIITTLISIFGINAISQILKGLVTKFGSFGIRLMVFCICLLVSIGYAVLQANPNLMVIAQHIMTLFLGAVATFELVWKPINSIVSPVEITGIMN